ncbi:phenylalanine racemase [Sporolactobacillus shoreicorticis]|uniref:Phenylalanine racemase n=1 Tax=Sporolactobacillus shoreicorticis TaxID=1923877 RepID=A0ABW5RYX5_9BACL|nr:phenylalanine racemase [Sporolactobacillus shoreicorticis]MCO7125118.1 phenylalanine racemase [Sporolactobacillus shoreicorticis]
MSRKEFDQLTEKEKVFIRKEYENKFLFDVTWVRNAVLNAEANVNRKKGKKFQELFPKKPPRADKEYNEQAMKTITAIEQKKGKTWVEKVYRANGAKKGG